MEENALFAVIKLSKEIIVEDDNGNQLSRQLANCYGFLPVYESYEEALAASEDGIFQIVPLIIQNNEVQQETDEQPNPDSEEVQTFE